MALAKTTKDHDEIRKWAEARGGKPAVVAATEGKDETGIIRLMFPNAPNHNDDALEEIEWDEWFEKFDESGLQLTYQEKTADGKQSDFNKLTYPDPDSPEGKALLKKSAGKKSSKKSAAKPAAGKTATKTSAKTSAKAETKPASKAASKTESKPATKAAAKPATKPATKKAAPATKAAAKAPAKKSAAKKSASKKSSPATPARNYPKPDHNGPTQVF